jgi:hypothetical protein
MALASPRPTSDETVPAVIATPSARRQEVSPAPLRMAMYFSPDGTLHHARCRRPLQFRGVRADLEGDFWCNACHEHVAVPRYAVPQIPVEAEDEGDRKAVVRLVR